jgi:hypothetical protein
MDFPLRKQGAINYPQFATIKTYPENSEIETGDWKLATGN